MRALKIIGIVLASLIIILLVLGLMAPKEFKVERSVSIPVENQEVIFKNISVWSEFLKWNPWSPKDPNQKVTFSGSDGMVGSHYHWKGNDDVGEGEMTITAIVPNQSVESDLHFISPMETTNKTVFTMKPENNGYLVTWTMSGKSPFPFNIVGLFMNMDKMVGSDFEKGLENLKAKCIAETSEKAPEPSAASEQDTTEMIAP